MYLGSHIPWCINPTLSLCAQVTCQQEIKAKRRENGCWGLSIPTLSDVCSVSGGSISDLCLRWPPTFIPFMPLLTLHSPPTRPAGSPPPLRILPPPCKAQSLPTCLRSPCSFPSPRQLLLSLNSSGPGHQQAPELSFTPACVGCGLPAGCGLPPSFPKVEILSNRPDTPRGPSTVLGSESVTNECMPISDQ